MKTSNFSKYLSYVIYFMYVYTHVERVKLSVQICNIQNCLVSSVAYMSVIPSVMYTAFFFFFQILYPTF